MHINDLKEKIIKISYFIGRDRIIKKQLWTLDQLEDELDLPKKEIIYILDCFVKAKLFHYTIIPTGPEVEEYDLFPTKGMIENRTGMIAIRYSLIPKENVRTIVELIESPYKLGQFIKKHCNIKKIPELVGDKFEWLGVSIPMERGHRGIIDALLEKPRTVSKVKGKNGLSLTLKEIAIIGPYGNEDIARNAIKQVNSKFNKNKLPIRIKNIKKGGKSYTLQIEKDIT